MTNEKWIEERLQSNHKHITVVQTVQLKGIYFQFEYNNTNLYNV